MIGLALSGGGSRAIAFHLGCLRALNDLGLLQQVGVISTISGGSVIGAYFAYKPLRTFEEFEGDIRTFLSRGFQRGIVLELAKPHNLVRCIASFSVARARRVIGSVAGQRYPTRTDMFRNVLRRRVFSGLTMTSPRRDDIEVVIGACELRTGTAFRFGTSKSGGWRHGTMANGDVDVAFAVAASAAYPIFLPALDRTWKFRKNGEEAVHRVNLTDGGVYDNLGTQVLEPGRDSDVSLHTFPCDYVIACNAGQGQESGEVIPAGFYTRIKQSFGVIHRRVQDGAMHRLHHLKKAGLLKGFVLPYLGQQDDRLPWKPAGLVPRSEVARYPTDFAAMSDLWVEKLSARGEQLTRLLVSYYLTDLLR